MKLRLGGSISAIHDMIAIVDPYLALRPELEALGPTKGEGRAKL